MRNSTADGSALAQDSKPNPQLSHPRNRAQLLPVFALTVLAIIAGCTKPHPAVPPPSPATISGQYRYVVLPTPAPPTQGTPGPKILEIDLSDQKFTAPGPVSARVRTTQDVISVAVRSMGRTFPIRQLAPGLFEGTDQLPSIPFFLKGKTYLIDFVAADAGGRTTTQTVSVYLNR